MIVPEIVEHPDSGKLGARSAAGERIMLARPGPTLDYWDGEGKPRALRLRSWPGKRLRSGRR
jgi:hypothetical protein